MGQRGPIPQPADILRLRGDQHASSKNKRKSEPKPSGKPIAQKWIGTEARAVFNRVVDQLDKMSLLGGVDENALNRYAASYVKWVECERFTQENGLTYDKGQFRAPHPEVDLMLRLSGELTRLEAQFGMTPSGRSRLKVEKPHANADDAAKAAFFKKGSA